MLQQNGGTTSQLVSLDNAILPTLNANVGLFLSQPYAAQALVQERVLPLARNALAVGMPDTDRADQLAMAYLADMLIEDVASRVATVAATPSASQGIVTTATPGSVASTGINGLITAGINNAVQRLGLGSLIDEQFGDRVAALLSPTIAPIVSSQLGLEGEITTTGLSGALANALAPYITEYVNQYVGGLIPEFVVRAALSAALTSVITPAVNYVFG